MSAYDNGYSIGKIFGEWIKGRRIKKGFSLEYSSFRAGISVSRLRSIEEGAIEFELTEQEIFSLSEVYGLDPRALAKRAKEGDI